MAPCRAVRHVVAACVVLVSSTGLGAEPVRLDLQQALALAAEHSPALAARGAARSAAHHRVRASTARMLPKLSVNVRYTRLSYVAPGEITLPFSLPNQPPPEPIRLGDPIENQFVSGVVLEQPLFTGLTLFNTRKSAQHSLEAASQQLIQEQQDLALRTEESYFGLLKARQILDVTEQSMKVLSAHLERLDRLVHEGAATSLDVSRTRTRLASTRVQLLQARAVEAVAQQSLLTLLGLDADAILELTQNLDELPPAPEGDLQAQAHGRPDLTAARAQAAAKEAQARAAAGGLWPQVLLRAGAQFDSPNQRYFPLRNQFNPSWDASVILAWTAWDWGATWHTQRAAHFEAVTARHAIAQMEDGVRIEVERRRLEAETAVARKRASLEAVEVADQSMQRAQRLCDAGQVPCIEVLDAEAELTRLRAEWVQSRIDLRLAASQLRRAIGTLSLPPPTKRGTP